METSGVRPTLAIRTVGRSHRTPAYVHSTVALVTAVVLASFLLSAPRSAPPAIAEISPQAVAPITEAPEDQAAPQGGDSAGPDAADGGDDATDENAAGGDDSGSGNPEDDTGPGKRLRRCVGNPPRQTEDPQSPPCVGFFEGDNGGATHQGVTATEIRIAAPNMKELAEYGIDMRLLEKYINNRFEFYGRKLRLVDTKLSVRSGSDPASQRQEAGRADDEFQVFGSLHMNSGGGAFYALELARRGVVVVVDRPNFSSSVLAENRPYMWQYSMAWDRIFANVGEWACARLADRNAERGGSDVRGKKRVFGIVAHTDFPDIPFDVKPLEQELARCNAPVEAVVVHDTTQGSDAWAYDAVFNLKANNVTTVMCMCHPHAVGRMMGASTDQLYFPEWVTSTYNLTDHTWYYSTFIQAHTQQASSVMGLTFRPREIPAEAHFSIRALREVDPNCCDQYGLVTTLLTDIEYRDLLVMAAGLQLAGPTLTPETFERGLLRARFPGDPSDVTGAGRVGFEGPSYSFTKDAAEFWWDPGAQPVYSNMTSGALCVLDGGRRYVAGSWPRSPGAFFSPPCDSGAHLAPRRR